MGSSLTWMSGKCAGTGHSFLLHYLHELQTPTPTPTPTPKTEYLNILKHLLKALIIMIITCMREEIKRRNQDALWFVQECGACPIIISIRIWTVTSPIQINGPTNQILHKTLSRGGRKKKDYPSSIMVKKLKFYRILNHMQESYCCC